ncbi:MAG TPA: CHAT domain-containing protein [Blastocatellia bacterium]|nr:CHAT domain-containing protein [Blastocatellia bacterium]
MKILFLAANPVDVISQLRIDHEYREISKRINEGTCGNQLELVTELAVRAGDLQAALLRHQPDIVHFSGHCSRAGGIVLEDEKGLSKMVSLKALSDLFSILKGNIRVVVLNACYAKDQAQALTGAVDCAIGMNEALEDKAALVFAAHFYQSLAFGRSVGVAFELARNQLEIEGIGGAQIPELLVRGGTNPSEIHIVKRPRPPVEPGSEAAPGEPAPAAAGSLTRPEGISGAYDKVIAGGPAMRGVASEGQQRKRRPIAFLPRLFASIAAILATDILRRFLGRDGGWLDIASLIVEIVLIIFAAVALLTAMSLLRPSNHFVEKAVRSGISNELPAAWRAALISGIVLVIALGLWLSLPVLAHYYNERGANFQFREQPNLSRARESYQLAVRLYPGYAQAHYNLALVQEDLQPGRAIEEYLLAIRCDSNIYPAYNNLARLYLKRGEARDYENALNILTQAEGLSPQDESVQYSLNKNLGWANYALKRYAAAETYLRRAISLRKKEGAAAHCLLAYVLKEQGKAEAADECYDCVSMAPGEKDIEAEWVSAAQDCFMKGGNK